jgi:hypothetical protein
MISPLPVGEGRVRAFLARVILLVIIEFKKAWLENKIVWISKYQIYN